MQGVHKSLDSDSALTSLGAVWRAGSQVRRTLALIHMAGLKMGFSSSRIWCSFLLCSNSWNSVAHWMLYSNGIELFNVFYLVLSAWKSLYKLWLQLYSTFICPMKGKSIQSTSWLQGYYKRSIVCTYSPCGSLKLDLVMSRKFQQSVTPRSHCPSTASNRIVAVHFSLLTCSFCPLFRHILDPTLSLSNFYLPSSTRHVAFVYPGFCFWKMETFPAISHSGALWLRLAVVRRDPGIPPCPKHGCFYHVSGCSTYQPQGFDRLWLMLSLSFPIPRVEMLAD